MDAFHVEGDEANFVKITPLGAGSEVGRSCHILEYRDKRIMLDCGIHPGGSGITALPFLEETDLSRIDILLVSHFHLDHAAALPYLLEKTDFKGRVFMTHPTKSIYKLILLDYVKVSSISVEENLYDERDLMNSMSKIECINFHQVVHHQGIKFWCYNAGHVLGAAMFMIEIAGVKILYTGDYSRREDRHLMPAEIPEVRPDILIVESTYGVQTLQPVVQREQRFCELVHQIIQRGGRVLIPVFALGRAQELLLILDEYWENHPSLQDFPIYYASALAKKCMLVYQTYIHMMNQRIQKQFQHGNPFVFKHISNLKGMDKFDDIGPSVVMASPGMLQNGLSRELFELWCSDPRNGCIIPGYCVEGTLAKDIMAEPSMITTLSGLQVPLKMSVHYVSFSAHADYSETSDFIDQLRPPHVILVHGEATVMGRLKQALQKTYADESVIISTPKNCQTVEIEFRLEKMAKIVGKLAAEVAPAAGNVITGAEDRYVSGVFVRKDFNDRILAVEDLSTYTSLSTSLITQSVKVPFMHSLDTLKVFLRQLYDFVEIEEQLPVHEMEVKVEKQKMQAFTVLTVLETVRLVYKVSGKAREDHILMEWESNPTNDVVSDSIICILMSIDSSPAAAKLVSAPCCHSQLEERSLKKQKTFGDSVDDIIASFYKVLEHQFASENVVYDKDAMRFSISYNESSKAEIDLCSFGVKSEDKELKKRLELLVDRTKSALFPVTSKPPVIFKELALM